MKRKDIKAGVVYAETRSYGPPDAVVFLEDGAATVWRDSADYRKTGPYIACDPQDKAKRGTGWSGRSQGYAAVRGTPELLEGLDVAAELEAFKARREPSRDGLWFTLVFSLGKVSGPYAEAVAAYEEEQSREREASRRRAAENDAAIRRLTAAQRAFAEFGIKASSGGTNLVSIHLDDAERLIALLREKGEG